MFQTFQTGVAIIVVCLLTPMAAEAQNLADRDAKEVADYVLTDATLSKYAQAVSKLHRPFSVRHMWARDRQLLELPDRAPDRDTHR